MSNPVVNQNEKTKTIDTPRLGINISLKRPFKLKNVMVYLLSTNNNKHNEYLDELNERG